MLFSRISTDGQEVDCTESLVDLYGGSECFVVGSAPGIADYDGLIQNSGIPVLACNLSGRDESGQWRIKPNIWTTYDPTYRFPKSIFNDGTIQKFVNHKRSKDLVTGTDEKLCDAPNTFFYQNGLRSYKDFFGPHPTINNSKDSFIQLLDIGYRLGFRKFHCVGVSLRVSPSKAQIELARSFGVVYEDGMIHVSRKAGSETQTEKSDLLKDFVNEVAKRGFNGDTKQAIQALESIEREGQYSFDETKSLSAAMSSDYHYFQTVQYLRLARKNMRLCGVELTTATTNSRLYPFFPQRTVESITVGPDHLNHLGIDSDGCENLSGLYSGRDTRLELPPHKDILPYDFVSYKAPKKAGCGCGGKASATEPPKPEQQPAEVERDGISLKRTISLPVNPPIPIQEIG